MSSDGGMGLGGVLLSSIAGAMIGSWLGNKLFNNQNFQNQRQAQYKSPQTYSKSQNSFNKLQQQLEQITQLKKSGFWGNNTKFFKYIKNHFHLLHLQVLGG